MATRAAIIMEVKGKDHSYEGVYLHFDGYPEGAGKKLVNHYRTPASVANLISHGGISVLGEMIGEKFDFDEKTPPQQCKFYHRDRGENLDIALLGNPNYPDDRIRMVEDYAHDCGAEFIYLYTNGRWTFKPAHNGFNNLEPHLKIIELQS